MEFPPPPIQGPVLSTVSDVFTAGRWYALMLDGWYRCNDLSQRPPAWEKITSLDVPVEVQRKVIAELQSGRSFYDDFAI